MSFRAAELHSYKWSTGCGNFARKDLRGIQVYGGGKILEMALL